MPMIRVAVAFTALLCGRSYSQTQAQFEVASIKPSSSSDPRTLLQVLPGGGLRTSGATLKFLVMLAYDLRSFQIVGGPGWITDDRFDVVGNSERSSSANDDPPDPTKVTAMQLTRMQNEMRPRLVALLAERYKLKVHRESREQPVFELVIGKNGSKLQGATGNFGGLHISRNQLIAEAATIDMLAAALANQLNRPVIDRTGLSGAFNFKLIWNPPDAPAAVDGAGPDTSDRPSIFTAVSEQLGLNLRSTRAPAEILIIDRVEKPTEN
jgi:uncharacterized protein (TIGR03435 family)